MVSRWTNGKQKLMPGHGWIDKVAGYMLSLDARLKEPVVPADVPVREQEDFKAFLEEYQSKTEGSTHNSANSRQNVAHPLVLILDRR